MLCPEVKGTRAEAVTGRAKSDYNGTILEILTNSLTEVVRWVGREPALAILLSAGAYLILLVLVLWTLGRSLRMARLQARLLRGADGATLERMLLEHVDSSATLRSRMAAVAEANTKNAGTLQHCLQRVGIVRYDAYGDVGGSQSFSIALLDSAGCGIVVTGLHGRSDMRMYAKPIIEGKSSLVLTDEERQAISESRAGGPVLTDEAALAVSGTATGGRRR